METIEQVKNSEETVKDPIINEGEKAFLFWKGKRYQGALGHEVLRIYLVKEGTIKTSSRSKKESVVTGTLFKKCIDIYSTLRQYDDNKKLLSDEEIFKRLLMSKEGVTEMNDDLQKILEEYLPLFNKVVEEVEAENKEGV
jgi:hypothetical protein